MSEQTGAKSEVCHTGLDDLEGDDVSGADRGAKKILVLSPAEIYTKNTTVDVILLTSLHMSN